MNRIAGRIHAFTADLAFNLVVNKLFGTCLIPRNLRWIPMRLAGMDTNRSKIGPGSYFGTRKIVIGYGAMVGPESYLDGAAPIVLEPRSVLGPRTMIITGGHHIEGPEQRMGGLDAQGVVVGAGAWLCANVTVLPGVKIGAGCVVAAGSVVSRDLEPNGLYAGFPARRVKELPVDITPADLAGVIAQASVPQQPAAAAA